MQARWVVASMLTAGMALRMLAGVADVASGLGGASGRPADPERPASAAASSAHGEPVNEGAGALAAQRTRADLLAEPLADDPETAAESFRMQVLKALEGPLESTSASARTFHSAGGRNVDWAYVEDVFVGRISGIPDERRAGLSLQELDEVGAIPYVEQLRKEKRFEELRELGFENETISWPGCLRTGTCRLDRASSPPS